MRTSLPRRRRAHRAAPPVALALALAACVGEDLRVSGTVEARRVVVAPQLSARIAAIHRAEGAPVAAGDLLVELDCGLQRAQRDEAAARVRQAEAELALLEAGAREQELEQARARLGQAEQELVLARVGARAEVLRQLEARREEVEARIELARRQRERLSDLVPQNVAAQAQLDEAEAELAAQAAVRRRVEAELEEARAGARPEERAVREREVDAARARLALLEEGARAEELAAARARVDSARGALASAEELVARCRLVAPVEGQVEVVDFEPGELVPAGTPLLALARSGPLRIRTFAPQAAIGRLEVGDPLRVFVDGRPDAPIEARVERIHDQAEFTAGNVQTPQDRMLLVYRVDLLAEPAPQAGLRPGANVTVDFAPYALGAER